MLSFRNGEVRMTKFGFESLARWCKENGYALDDWVPRVTDAGVERIDLTVPANPLSITELIDDLVAWPNRNGERVVWIRDWTIWNDRSQEIGLCHLDLLGRAACYDGDEPSARIYLLSPGEWKEAITLLSVPILYSWDAHLLFQSGGAEVDFSHEDRITVWFSANDNEAKSRFQAWQEDIS
jgi:hypothetical protein